MAATALALWTAAASAAPPPGAAAAPTLDPLTIPKYVQQLVIPPEMPKAPAGNPDGVDYRIAVRQFTQQILPPTDTLGNALGQTTVWSYGSADAPGTVTAGGSFFYPAFTVENTTGVATKVKWINDLVVDPVACAASPTPATDPACNYLPHLLPVDQTLHWANPGRLPCTDGTSRTDCQTADPNLYTGPVPIVTHVHGAHVGPESDGFPEAWWLPAANNIPAGYATAGDLFDDTTNANPGNLGYAVFNYPNTQRASTVWYHDHSLGLTRSNVYAGPAGFWLIRDPAGTPNGDVDILSGTLPGPSPRLGDAQGNNPLGNYYEIPMAIQDRSFNADGSLFYPDSRAFFELTMAGMTLNPATFPFIPDPSSDIAPVWNPEAFFDTMVVNGRTWPNLNVEPRRYRFRLLNGCNSRTLNLSLWTVDGAGNPVTEIPIYLIGTDGGLLPQVVEVLTGFNTPLPGNGTIPAPKTPAPFAEQALLLPPAYRADVIVDFTNVAPGTLVRMFNTAPDTPFGGFPDVPANPSTTGQVMQFTVGAVVNGVDASTPPASLQFRTRAALPAPVRTRKVSLNEEESSKVCVAVDALGAPVDPYTVVAVPPFVPPTTFAQACVNAGGVPFAPKAALLGTVITDPVTGANAGVPLLWMDSPTELPGVNDTEQWDIYNFTVDAHPIHLHQVMFQVLNRETTTGAPDFALTGTITPPDATESGWKDTIIAYPGEVTRVRATFDMSGLYVWHCHILEHEDNEMMRPYAVPGATAAAVTLLTDVAQPQVAATAQPVTFRASASPKGAYEYRFWLKDPVTGWTIVRPYAIQNSWTWTPPVASGTYYVQVDVRKMGSSVKWDVAAVTRYVLKGQTPGSVTVSPSAASPQVAGTSITFTAAGQPAAPAGSYEYRFWLKNPDTGWSVVRPYSTATTWTWNSPAGTYGTFYVQVDVRARNGTTNRDASTVVPFVLKSATVLSLAALPASAQNAGAQVTFTASGAPAAGGPWEYRFWVKDPATGWAVAQPYGASTTFDWASPGVAGQYYIQVDVRKLGRTSARDFAAVLPYTLN